MVGLVCSGRRDTDGAHPGTHREGTDPEPRSGGLPGMQVGGSRKRSRCRGGPRAPGPDPKPWPFPADWFCLAPRQRQRFSLLSPQVRGRPLPGAGTSAPRMKATQGRSGLGAALRGSAVRPRDGWTRKPRADLGVPGTRPDLAGGTRTESSALHPSGTLTRARQNQVRKWGTGR